MHGFADFVLKLTAIDLSTKYLNHHYAPITRNGCLWSRGYDYFLPLEQQPLWYEPFVRALGLDQIVATGWNVTTALWRGGAEECFFAPPGHACDWRRRSAPAPDTGTRNSHSTAAGAKLDQFYTASLAAAVSSWARDDLRAFKYRAWDGLNAQGYLSSLASGNR